MVTALFAAIYWATGAYLEHEVRSLIGEELSSLAEDAEGAGIEAAIPTIEQRMASPEHGSSFYLLQDPNGGKIAGNLPSMPPVAGWHELPIPEDKGGEDPDDLLIAEAKVLSNGWFLAVGRDKDDYADVGEWMFTVAGWSLAFALALALIVALKIQAKMLRRIDIIADAGRSIMTGALTHRIPVRGTGDEYDRLSAGLNEMLDRIQKLMEGLRQVSNDIAHDLRTPLTRLRQRLEGARAKARTVAEYEAATDKAIAETDEILAIFGALLRIAQIEAGTRRSAFAEIDLSGVLDSIVEIYAPVAEDEHHGLVGAIAGGIKVRGDRQLLTQMFANIIENSLRHTPAGTRIDVQLTGTPAGPVCIIADNGPGIPEAEWPHVFRRFYRASASRADPGNGLGLSLVAAVAELHRVGVEIGDNRPGLRLTLRFP